MMVAVSSTEISNFALTYIVIIVNLNTGGLLPQH